MLLLYKHIETHKRSLKYDHTKFETMSRNALNHMPKQAHMAHTSISFCGSVWLSLFFLQKINFEIWRRCFVAQLTLRRGALQSRACVGGRCGGLCGFVGGLNVGFSFLCCKYSQVHTKTRLTTTTTTTSVSNLGGRNWRSLIQRDRTWQIQEAPAGMQESAQAAWRRGWASMSGVRTVWRCP